MNESEVKAQEQFFRNWRNSEFYDFVIAAITNEMDKSYVKDVMTARILNNEPMDNDEIAEEMKVEVRSNLRIKSILEVLK